MMQDFFPFDIILPIIIALAVLLAVFFLRNLMAKAIIRLLFTRLKCHNKERYQQVRDTLIKPISFMVLTGTARIALEYFSIPDPYLGIVANIFSTLFLSMAFWAFYSVAGLTVSLIIAASHKKDSKVDANAANYVSVAIKITIVTIGVFVILSRWVSDISGLIAGLGIGGLAIALAAQDTASNLFGSIAIMLDKPFEIGDWVEVEGLMGTVIYVGLRSSKIRALDQSIVSVPNSKLAVSTISNGTKRLTRRVAFKIGIVYSTPPMTISAYIEKIKDILESDPDVEDDGILVCFENFADSSLEIFVCYFTLADYTDMMHVKQRINLAILKSAEEMGVSMAFPSISLYYGNREN